MTITFKKKIEKINQSEKILLETMIMSLGKVFQREDISKIRNEIKDQKINYDDTSMKNYRSNIIQSKKYLKSIINSDDFYCMSSFRDLLFHIHESHYTLCEISNCLDDLNLRFSGFEGCTKIKEFKSENLVIEDLYNLKKWDRFEKKNKHTFEGMYQFWCQKVK